MTTEMEVAARTVMERCDVLGSFSEEPDRLTRRMELLADDVRKALGLR